jgi:error-prone DNA polymerase
MPGYIELHARSAFSFLRGASLPEELMAWAAELEMPGLAVTDRNGVYGSARAQYRAKELGLTAWVGAELAMDDGSVLPVLVQSRAGYQNLCRLLTQTHLHAPKGLGCVRWSELENFASGLIALSGDEEGPVRRALEDGDDPRAKQKLCDIVRIFGQANVAVELQRQRLRGEEWTNRRLVDLAAAHRLPLIATGGVACTMPDRRPLLDAFTCLRHHTTLDAAGLLLAPNSERHLKSGAEMRDLFSDLPDALENTHRLAGRLEFTLENLGYEFPRYAVPSGEGDATAYLRKVTFDGARNRYRALPGGFSEKVRAQLDHELELISRLGFCGYFLIVWDLVRWAASEGIFCQGRGSAANSAVCFSLGITNVDPVGSSLLFERFLSDGRHTWPDIDIDFPSGDQRERVIQEVYRRFAPHGAAMTANVITYRGRSAMRDMGKVLGIPEDICGRFSDLHGHGDHPHTLEMREHLRLAGLPENHPRRDALIQLFVSALGLPRHLGQHSGGMIICDHGLDHYVPLEPATMPGRVVVQWDKDDCEDLGLIKIDLLGLGMLAAIEDTLALCKKRGRAVDLANIPKDDPAVFEMLQRADTIGLFQVESRAQQATLPRMKPEKFYDLVIETAIIRPGPIVGKLVHPYLNRRSGKEEVDYIDERFRPALERTLGVPLFQEQILKMAMLIADFSGSEAEELRRAMSFQRSPERMEKVMDKLRAAMMRKGVPQRAQEQTIKSIRSFALYGFPESHAISFALIAYASAWLKVHRTAEFYVGLFNAQPMGFYSVSTLAEDAERHGIRVFPVCVVKSALSCSVEAGNVVRLGLNQVRGLCASSAERLVTERDHAQWKSLDDFHHRTRLPKDERRVLARIGAFKELSTHRRDALWRLEAVEEADSLFAGKKISDFRSQNADFQKTAANDQASEICTLPSALCNSILPPMTAPERLEADYAGLGLTTGPHPMALIRPRLPRVTRACDLNQIKDGRFVIIAGMVICRQRPGTAKGHVFISLEDETGIANAFVPSSTFEKFRLVVTQEPFLEIKGRLQNSHGVISVYAMKIDPLHYDIEVGSLSHDFR